MVTNKKLIKAVSTCLVFLFFCSCKSQEKNNSANQESLNNPPSFLKLSLAEWSLHKTFNNKGVSPFDFAKIADSLGFDTLEYVSQLYKKQIQEMGFDSVVNRLLYESNKYGLRNNLIMVDGEGNLASPDTNQRKVAVENHKKWVDAAKKLGCQAIRVNTFGTNNPEEWKASVIDALRELSEYAAKKSINVICENHGWLSSDIPKLMDALNTLNFPNCGTLPDFGNWCIKRSDNYFGGNCLELFPNKYEGIKLMMPRAKGVSAKSYDFDADGNETTIDYKRMLQIIKDSGFTGIIGVEYEGSRLNEVEGILATKNLLLRTLSTIK